MLTKTVATNVADALNAKFSVLVIVNERRELRAIFRKQWKARWPYDNGSWAVLGRYPSKVVANAAIIAINQQKHKRDPRP